MKTRPSKVRASPRPVPMLAFFRTPGARDSVAGPSSATDRRQGFALLITIVLVAFLVLLLVGLATFTRVETQVASNSQQQSQARQNALMALNLAVGELQKYTGPDQRTTARSDMDVALSNTTTRSGRWLGAYGSGAGADYTMRPSAVGDYDGADADVLPDTVGVINSASDAKGCQAKLLNWLVSGNERTAFDPIAHVGPTGAITTPPTQFEFAPTGAVAGLAASSNALSPNLTVADRNGAARPARLLVGPASVGDSVADYVVAPLREITAIAPGMGVTPVPVGRYAWWVGDEGTKARVDLPLPTDAAQAPNAFVSSQRSALEFVDAINPSSTPSLASANMLDPTGAANRFDPSDTDLGRLVSLAQLPMIADLPANSTTLTRVARYRFHDIGAWSASVLSDTYAGGLKEDLSSILSTQPPAVGHPSHRADTDFIFPLEPTANNGGARPQFGMPTWGLLRSHVQTTAGAGALAPSPPGMTRLGTEPVPRPTSAGISPVITYAYIGLSYGVPNSYGPSFDAIGNPVQLAISPIVVLWNPYTTDIAGSTYEVGFRKNNRGRFELQARNSTDAAAWSSSHVIHTGDLNTFNGSNDRFVRFIIDNSAGIPAGESLVFTLGRNAQPYAPADTTNPLVNEYHPGYHVLRDTGVVIGTTTTNSQPLAVGATYRVGVKGAWVSSAPDTIPTTFFGSADANFAGGDPHEVYLGVPGATPPDTNNTNYPYDNTFASRRWYQMVGNLHPSVDISPYGKNHGYATHRAGSSEDPNGLFRNESTIDGINQPTFRMGFFMGFKDSRDRWLAQSNPRALVATAGNFIRSPVDSGNWPTSITALTPATPRAHAGMGLKYTGTTAVNAQVFEFRPSDQPLLGIGQLQHANLSWASDSASYAIGNSLLPAYFTTPFELHDTPAPFTRNHPPGTLYTVSYDHSWLLNHALWDRFFVSTVPHPGTGLPGDTNSTDVPDDVMRNPRLQRRLGFTDDDLRDAGKAAAALMLTGGFNINSTSEQAWRAVLGGINQLDYNPVTGAQGSTRKAVLSRFSRPKSAAPGSINSDNAWSGYRELDESQIATLARSIVAEIRRRGPAISLADFINRRLKDDGNFPLDDDKRLKGTLQAAIDAVTADDAGTGAKAVNNRNDAPFDAGTAPSVTDSYSTTTLSRASKSGQASGGTAAIVYPYSSPSAFAPQFLTQADVLSAIGAGLSGRSDTFTIRTYGEVLDPVNSTPAAPVVISRAWCEAVVQRLPDYVDSSGANAAHLPPAAGTNTHFGRRYQIVSFRWLSPDDI